ncbi:MAG: DUF882 domain-containing protein [Acidobacteriaceae bacterium]|nr:DUF882 domain-containing protein [Acidobacteriaceae bacterium]
MHRKFKGLHGLWTALGGAVVFFALNATIVAQGQNQTPTTISPSYNIDQFTKLIKSAQAAPSTLDYGDLYRLHLHFAPTSEDIDVVYRIGSIYLPDAIAQLNNFLRDHHTETVKPYDLREFDLLHDLLAKLDLRDGVIDVLCGYRTPLTNHLLRMRRRSGVAEHSQHIEAKAIDIRVPGVETADLRNAALSLGAGGVGYYPYNHFVHVDVGPVREWTFGGGRSRRTSHRGQVTSRKGTHRVQPGTRRAYSSHRSSQAM